MNVQYSGLIILYDIITDKVMKYELLVTFEV